MPTGAEGFQPGRLTMAREGRALRKRELAHLVGRTEAAVSKWESSERPQKPEANTIPELAAALSVDNSWFFKPLVGDDRPVFYRSLRSGLNLLRDQARARLGFVEAIEQALTTHVDLPDVDVPDLVAGHDFRTLRTEDIEAIADDLRTHWHLPEGPIDDVLLLMENAGVVIAEDEIGSLKLDGVSWWSERSERPYVLLARDKKAGVRRRFDAAHELAHLVLHRNIRREQLVENFTLVEEQAMAFAGCFLMPAGDFASDVYSLSLDSLLHIKEKWAVSVGAMIKRLAALGEIPEHYERRLWQYYSQRRWRGREPLDDKLPIEQPENLKTAIQMLIEDGECTPQHLLREIGLSVEDVTVLSGLPVDFFDQPRDDPTRRKPTLRVVQDLDGDAADSNVIPWGLPRKR